MERKVCQNNMTFNIFLTFTCVNLLRFKIPNQTKEVNIRLMQLLRIMPTLLTEGRQTVT